MVRDNVPLHRDTQALPMSIIMTEPGTKVVDEVYELRRVLRRIGGVPDFVVTGYEETILGYLMARLG